MAYGNQANQGRTYGSRPAAATQSAQGGKREFKDDPTEVGIGYTKELKAGGNYVAISILKDIPAGSKLVLFNNDKVKNRTDKTPTHKLKLSVRKQA